LQFPEAPLTMTEIGDQRAGSFDQAHARQRRLRRFTQFWFVTRVLPKPKRVAGMGLHRKRDIVERCEIRKQRCDLERARKA
jgi:hypothetical protein